MINPDARCKTPGALHAWAQAPAFVIRHVFFAALFLAHAAAQEAFTPPQAYPAGRYEAGWNKNPFTLKTAAVAIAKESIADKYVIAAYYGSSTNPTVVIADKTTRDRTPLKLGQPAANGMTLKSASIKPSRKETSAEITLGDETVTVHFDNSFISQMAAQGGVVAQPGAGQANVAGQPAMMAMNNPAAAAVNKPGMAGAPQGAPGNVRPTLPPGTQPNPYSVMPPQGAGTNVQNAINASGNVPTPVRRRLLTAPVPQTPSPVPIQR